MSNNPSVELAPLQGKVVLNLDEYKEALDEAEEQALDMEQTLEEAFENIKFNINFTELDSFKEKIDSLFTGVDFSSSFEGIESAINSLSKSVMMLKSEMSDFHINIDMGNTNETLGDVEFLELKINGLLEKFEELQSKCEFDGQIQISGISEARAGLEELDIEIEDVRRAFEDLSLAQSDSLAPSFSNLTLRVDDFKSALSDVEAAGTGATTTAEELSDGMEDVETAGIAGAEGVEKGTESVKEFRGAGEGFDIWTTLALITPLVMAGKKAIELGISYQSGLAMCRREFGLTQKSAVQWATKTSAAVGLSKDKVLQLTGQFGLAFKAMGANDHQAQTLSTKMLDLAQNMVLASGGSISLQTATQDLTGMLSGQTYGLKALGLSASNAALNQLALNSQWHTAYKNLTPLQQATIQLQYYQGALSKSMGSLGTNLHSSYGQFKTLQSQLENTGEQIGIQLMPVVLKLGRGLNTLLKAFSKLSPPIQHLIEYGSMFALVWKPMKSIFSAIADKGQSLIDMWNGLKDALTITAEDTGEVVLGLGDLLDPLTLVATTIGVVYEAWRHNWFNIRGVTHTALHEISHNFKHQMSNIGNELKKGQKAAKRSINNFVKDVGTSYHHMTKQLHTNLTHDKKVWKGYFKDVKTKAKNFHKDFVKDTKAFTKKVKTDIKNGLNDMKNDIESHIKSLKSKAKALKTSIENGVKSCLNKIKSYLSHTPFGKFVTATVKLFKTMITDIKKIFDALVKFIGSWILHFTDKLINGVEYLAKRTERGFKRMGRAIKRVWHDFTQAVYQVWTDFKNKFEATIAPFINEAKELADGVKNKIKNGFKDAVNSAKRIWNDLKNWFSSNIQPIINDAENVGKTVANKVKNGFTDAKNFVTSIWNSITSWFSSHITDLVNSATQMGSNLKQSIESTMSSVKTKITNGWNDICSWWSNNIGKPVTALEQQASQWLSAGENLITSLWDGLKSKVASMFGWLTGVINHITSVITGATGDITGFLNSHDGSHAVGLGYVPWDGYSAQLHKGEMVLTADEAEAYRNGSGSSGGGNTYNIYSPKPLDAFQVRNEIETLNRNLANGFS